MDENKLKEKNRKISESISKTRAKRTSQVCRVFTTKINYKKLNKKQKTELNMIFIESKWFYNYILSNDLIFSKEKPDKINIITRYNKDGLEIEEELNYLGSSMKQSILTEIKHSILSLGRLKMNNNSVGRLKFKSSCESINLKQIGITHSIKKENKIKIQGISKNVHLNGMEQFFNIPDIELANAKLLKKSSGFYVSFTTYTNSKNIPKKETNGKIIGVDFGCQTQFTLSNGEKIKAVIEQPERQKSIQRQLKRLKKGSKNYYKKLHEIKKYHEKTTNRKNDLGNKIVSYLLKNDIVIIQDEQLNKWKINHGKKIQYSVLGRVKEKLMKSKQTFVIDKYIPTTKFCRNCGSCVGISLNERTFKCSCGVSQDRDIHASENMVWIYEKFVGKGRAEVKRVEFIELVKNYFYENSLTVKHEATRSLA